MKIIFEERDKQKAKIFMAAEDAFSLLLDIDQKCRELIKYQELSEETEVVLQNIRDMIHEDNLLDLWE